jgi:hypothetical protein
VRKRSYFICNLAEIILDGDSPWFGDLVHALGDLPSLSARWPCPDTGRVTAVARLSIEHRASLSTAGLRELQPGLYTGKETLVDRRYGVQLVAAEPGMLLVLTDRACVEWLAWGLELVLLQSGATLIHGAGVERGGRAALFPSWGGVGKTAIAKHFVGELGWKLLGDDLVILDESGECVAFPKPMVLYPYHRRVFPEVFESGAGPVAPTSAIRALSRLGKAIKPWLRRAPGLLQWARRHNPQSRRVTPSRVFGVESLATTAELDAVVWLDRIPGLAAPEFCRLERNDMASRIFGSTMREQDPWCLNATLVACGLGLFGAGDIFARWLGVLDHGLRAASHWKLLIPQDTPIDQVGAVVDSNLRSVLPEMFRCR